MRTSLVRGAVAVLAAGVLGLTGACSGSGDGGEGDKGADASASPSAAKGKGKSGQGGEQAGGSDAKQGGGSDAGPLDKAGLGKAAITTADVKGYEVSDPTEEQVSGAGRGKAGRPECQPLVSLLTGIPEPKPSAHVYRQVLPNDQSGNNGGKVLFEILSSHQGDGAQQVMSKLRKAVSACAAGFTVRGGDSAGTYTAVQSLPEPKAGGNEALAFELTGEVEGDDMPLVFSVVRKGSSIASLYSVDFMSGKRSVPPASLLAKQADKLP